MKKTLKLHFYHKNSKLNSKMVPVLLIFLINLLPSPVQHTGFPFHFFSGFLAFFILLSSSNDNITKAGWERKKTNYPRDQGVSAAMWHPSHHITMASRGLREALNWVPIMPRDASLSDSRGEFFCNRIFFFCNWIFFFCFRNFSCTGAHRSNPLPLLVWQI